MKKVLILLIFSFLTCFVTFAQNSSTVTLTAEQYNSLPSNVKERIEKENTYKTNVSLKKKCSLKENMNI